jgi:hypothetical protein
MKSTRIVIEKLHPPEEGYGAFRYTKIDKTRSSYLGNHKREFVQDFRSYAEAFTYYPRATSERKIF